MYSIFIIRILHYNSKPFNYLNKTIMKKAVKFLAVLVVVLVSNTFVSCETEETVEKPLTELQTKERTQLWSLGLFKDYKVISIVDLSDGSDATLTTKKSDKDDVFNIVKKEPTKDYWTSPFDTNIIRSRNNVILEDASILFLEFFPLGVNYSDNDNFMMGAGSFTFMAFRFEELTTAEKNSWNTKFGNQTLTVKDFTNTKTVTLNPNFRKISFVILDAQKTYKYTLYTETLR